MTPLIVERASCSHLFRVLMYHSNFPISPGHAKLGLILCRKIARAYLVNSGEVHTINMGFYGTHLHRTKRDWVERGTCLVLEFRTPGTVQTCTRAHSPSRVRRRLGS